MATMKLGDEEILLDGGGQRRIVLRRTRRGYELVTGDLVFDVYRTRTGALRGWAQLAAVDDAVALGDEAVSEAVGTLQRHGCTAAEAAEVLADCLAAWRSPAEELLKLPA